MNLREGTRRLPRLLGALGAIAGGFASYLELQTVLDQRARHNKFEQLATSDVVKQERKALKEDFLADAFAIDPKTGERLAAPQTAQPKHGPWEKYATPASPSHIREYDAQGNPISSQFDRGDVKTIHWTKDFRVESMETVDGQTLYPTPAQPKWLYLLVALLPGLGFFIPWGAIRAIGWVGAGFFQPLK